MPQPFNEWYAANGMAGNPFLRRGFGNTADRQERVKVAAVQSISAELLAELREQDDVLPPSVARREHLRELAQAGSVVVATGQQVGLFLGPLYTLYKAASAVVIARRLRAETGCPCVPLFWLQTEDHDFHEIATCAVPEDGRSPLLLHLDEGRGEDRCSVAHRVLGDEAVAELDRLAAAIEHQPCAAEVMDLLRAHYVARVSPGHAFACTLAALFAEDGLLVFDPRRSAVARLAVPVIRRAIVAATEIGVALGERARALGDAGFDIQVPLRPDCALVFFHHRAATGARHRLRLHDGRVFAASDEEPLSEGDLLSLLEQEPLLFSTSALLRPIVQDTLFPTAVYVGGPAEVSYFAQVPPLYSIFGREPPLLAERAHFRLVPARVRTLLHKLGLEPTDTTDPRAAWLARHSTAPAVPSTAWAAELNRRLDDLIAPGCDEGVRRQAEKLRQSARHGLDRLAEKQRRATLERDDVAAQRLARLEGWLRPGGSPQERVHSFPAYAAKVGLKSLHDAIIDAVDPYDSRIRDIDL